ncbi:MAG: hypothetical protein KJO54_08165 [Gammaproteobacteria bacterium]|nr:hypothetical protein [Gammaproteobacteria bacterium]NNF60281.1 hypothetical protein [Gammaproteobacteria bacterium]NNM20389.1 hypothetical protein [Gammaproteobacteria bacterium]
MRSRVALLLLLLPVTANAVCQFDQSGTISNPDDPACRDSQFVYTENDNSSGNLALGYAPPIPVDSLTAVSGFRSYGALYARHQDLLLTEPSVAGQIVGQTRSGRDIWAYVLGDPDNVSADGSLEGAAIINGGIHAREWQSPEVVTEIFEQLVELSGDGSIGQFLHDNFNVVLIPVLNIDGFIQTQNFPTRVTADFRQPRDGRMRRKNMRRPAGSLVDEDLDTTDDSFFGVDLNRNSVYGFALNGGSSNNSISLVYRGSAASSEPEIQALRAATQLGPADRLRLGIDVHSFTQIYFTPQTGNTRRDSITADLANRMRAVTGFKYRYGPDPAGSLGIGTVADYFAYEFQIPAWTLEVEPRNGGQDYGGSGVSHSGFVLPDGEIARVRDEMARTHLLGFYRQAGPPFVNAIQIKNLTRDEVVYDARWLADGDSRRLQVDVSRALVPAEDHRIWVGFSKPMRWFDSNDLPADYPGQASSAEQLEMATTDSAIAFFADVTSSSWLDQPGGAPDGYQNWRGDAFSVELPWSQTPASASTPTAATVQLALTDFAQMQLDANPATPVDWNSGYWNGYEDSALQPGDVGGANCSFVIYFANDPDAAAPAGQQPTCSAFRAATAPAPAPPAPAPTPPQAPSGGGGNALWLLATALLLRRAR